MNRTRASSLDAFGLRDQRNRIFPALEASDGSTLSLNFTQMSSLDSRFTFTRSTSSTFSTLATFINSQGYVQFDDHNLVRNSTFSSLTGWAPTGSGTTTNAGGVLTLSTSAVQTQLYYAQTNANGFQDNSPISGRVYSASIQVNSISGGISYEELITVGGTISNVARYLNGTLVTSPADPATTGLITIVWTSGGANTLRIGIGASGSTTYPSASVSISLPRCVIGSQVQPTYIESPVSNTYHGPRFDYDPTTLTPRGLLIEGAATNLATRSDDFNTSVSDGSQWVPNSYTSGTLSTTLPDGTTGNARRISLASGSGSFRSQALTVTASTAYTWSFWARNNGGSQARYRVWNVTAGSSIVDYTLSGSNYVSLIGGANNTSSTWVRVSVSFTTPAGCTSVYVYPCSSDSGSVDLLVWGAQVEAGSGASSYIPTTTATMIRRADKLTMSDISLMGWNQTAGTFLWDMDVQSETNTSSFPAFAGMYRAGPVRVIRFQLNNSSGTNPRIGGGTWTATPSALVADTFYTRSVATPFKAAVAFANTGQSMTYCINGTVQSTVTGTGTLATPTLFLMHQDPSAADTEYFPIHLRQLKYWPTNLSSSDLRSITT